MLKVNIAKSGSEPDTEFGPFMTGTEAWMRLVDLLEEYQDAAVVAGETEQVESYQDGIDAALDTDWTAGPGDVVVDVDGGMMFQVIPA